MVPKNSWNQRNQFHGIFFLDIFHFLNIKLLKFLWKIFKNFFHEIDSLDFTSFFLAWTFLNSMAHRIVKKNPFLIIFFVKIQIRNFLKGEAGTSGSGAAVVPIRSQNVSADFIAQYVHHSDDEDLVSDSSNSDTSG